MERVKNVATHGVDLSDGRQLAPGEFADEVAVGNPHNKRLIDNGKIAVVGGAEKSDTESGDGAVELPPPVPPAPESTRPRRPGATPAEEK